jgi:hypothetical protein
LEVLKAKRKALIDTVVSASAKVLEIEAEIKSIKAKALASKQKD